MRVLSIGAAAAAAAAAMHVCMEASRPEHEIRGDPAAPHAAGGVAGGLPPLRQLEVVGVARRIQDGVFLFWGCLVGLLITTIRQLIESDFVTRLHAVASFLFRGCWGAIGGSLWHLTELDDRRLKAGAFFLALGGCTVLNATALNPSANPEHLLAGFFVFILGAVITILTLAGAGAGRAAARMERFLRGFF